MLNNKFSSPLGLALINITAPKHHGGCAHSHLKAAGATVAAFRGAPWGDKPCRRMASWRHHVRNAHAPH